MEIKNKLTGEVILTVDGDTLLEADLRLADLQGADLRGTDLQGADLRGADLRGADLQGADLQGANLRGADLRGADLQGADLRWADLRWANLREADLQGADLRRADLRWADLPTEVIIINGMQWSVTILNGYMRIGCQHHHVDDWDKFTDDEISKMDSDALEFWQKSKHKLITIASFTKE